jgi:hypothetical protein
MSATINVLRGIVAAVTYVGLLYDSPCAFTDWITAYHCTTLRCLRPVGNDDCERRTSCHR